MSAPENPPAFPTEWSWGLEPGEAMQTGEHKAQYPGMTLRDWFAGRAVPMVPQLDGADGLTYAEIAHDCYLFADAMLAERKKGGAS